MRRRKICLPLVLVISTLQTLLGRWAEAPLRYHLGFCRGLLIYHAMAMPPWGYVRILGSFRRVLIYVISNILILLGYQGDLLPADAGKQSELLPHPGHPLIGQWSKNHAFAAFLSGDHLGFPRNCVNDVDHPHYTDYLGFTCHGAVGCYAEHSGDVPGASLKEGIPGPFISRGDDYAVSSR